jgi:hypothetical protein
VSLSDLDVPITICTFITGIAVLAGFGFGLRALVLAKSNPETSSLNLMALNLLEPGVTMTVLFAVFTAGGMHASEESTFLLPTIGAIPLTWMLLAPLWTRITHPIRGTLIAYGLLRWLNTVAFWIAGAMALTQTSSNDLLMLASGLIVSGTLILCLSVTHLASSLSDFQVKPTVTPAGS